MKVLFDSSALVAALWMHHPRHSGANDWLSKVWNAEVQGYVSQHAIAEAFASLTSLSVSPAFHPHSVRTVLGEALWHLQLVPLDEADYVQMLEEATDRDLRGETSIALLNVRAALKVQAEKLLTVQPKSYLSAGSLSIVSI
jgi:predicted nucleic acid-binding protein